MKLNLATESQPVALALQSVNGGTGEAVDSICSKYSPRGTVMGFAEAYVFSLENVPVHSREEKERERGERDRREAGVMLVGELAGRVGGQLMLLSSQS